jgi:voltage-gated potassium channel
MTQDPTRRDNFTYLAAALIFLILALSLMQEFMPDVQGPVLEAITVMTLLIGVRSTRLNTQVFRAGFALAAILTALLLAHLVIASSAVMVVNGLVLIAFFTLTIWASLRQVLLTRTVDANSVVGAICIYLMSAVNWAIVYALEELLRPGSFHGLDTGSVRAAFMSLLYFSFSTLTTVGYGDVVPVHPIARVLAMMETVAGQFYMAILVATLVGARTTNWGKAE